MGADRLLRFGGLALVLLFPLLSVLQLSDGVGPWQEAAERARPSVLGLYRAPAANPTGSVHSVATGAGETTMLESGELVACGVVLEAAPLRLVVPGRLTRAPLYSRHDEGWLRWSPLCTDVQGEFTVLQADGFEADEGRAAPSNWSDLVATATVHPDPQGRPAHEVEVALVAPADLEDQPLWVGVLRSEVTRTGRSTYTSSFLHPVQVTAGLSAATAHADSDVQLAASLRGAPFVDAQGNAVAIFVGRDGRGMRGLAVETVIQSLLMLHLQTAN